MSVESPRLARLRAVLAARFAQVVPRATVAAPAPVAAPATEGTGRPARSWRRLLLPPGTSDGPSPRSTRTLRLALAVVSLLALLVGSLGFLLGAAPLQIAGLGVFVVLGVGSAPWQLVPRLGAYERLALTLITAAATMVLGSELPTAVHFWQPIVLFLLLTAAAVPLHVLGLLRVAEEADDHAVHRHRRDSAEGAAGWPRTWFPIAPDRDGARRILRAGILPIAAASAGAVLCLVAALAHRHLDPGYYGFLPRIGPLWYVGLALILLALPLGSRDYTRAVPVSVLALVLTLTPAIVYDAPRAQSAAKHVDFVQWIQSSGVLETSNTAYNAYAGFFDAVAWLCSVCGIAEPLVLATFWPALLALFRVVALRYLAGQFLRTSAQSWTAVTLTLLVDAISADYFSPQALGYVLGMAAVAVAMTRNRHVPRLVLLLVAGLTLTLSHQLSPYMVGCALVVLAVFRLLRPWWAPALVLGPAVGWAVLNWGAIADFIDLRDFGQLSNFTPPAVSGGAVLDRLPVVQYTTWATLAGIGILACLALVVLLMHLREAKYWALACCPAVGLVLVAAQPYGREAVFRAALFGIPWLAILAAPLLAGPRLRTRVALLVAASCLVSTFAVASFGLDAFNVMRPSDYAAVRHYEALGGRTPPHEYVLLLLNSGDQPTGPDLRGGHHPVWARDVINELPGPGSRLSPASEMRRLTTRLVDQSAPLAKDVLAADVLPYALWSPVAARYQQAYGVATEARSAALRDAFASSGYWSVAYQKDGTVLFRLEVARYRATVKR